MRGVNKLILEIKNTDNEFFDRAILFLKPEKMNAEQSQLNENAMRLLSAVRMDGINKRRRVKTVLIIAGAVLLVVGVLFVVLI
ncbi:MAG: hypothetical protein HDT44_01480 [Ruminococcaceae bacterium]|nr:hypothetical protein [Oscillospiraceae bacterium]